MSTKAQKTSILVWLTSGEKISLTLEDHPKIITNELNISVVSKNTNIMYAYSDVKKITFEELTTGITNTPVANINGSITFTESNILFRGFNPLEQVFIYNTSGLLISKHSVNNQGNLDVNTSCLGKGLYIVKTNSQSFKFLKKWKEYTQ